MIELRNAGRGSGGSATRYLHFGAKTWKGSSGKGERKIARETKETSAFRSANISRERKQPPIPSCDSGKKLRRIGGRSMRASRAEL